MKLKGNNSKKIPSNKKNKMEKTLKRMEETRKKDSINLRDKINKKIEDLTIEKDKADTIIDSYEKKIIELKETKLRIEGAIISLQEMVKNDTDI